MTSMVERLLRAGDQAMPGDECAVYYDAADRIRELEKCLRRIRDKQLTGAGDFNVAEYIAAVLQREGEVSK